MGEFPGIKIDQQKTRKMKTGRLKCVEDEDARHSQWHVTSLMCKKRSSVKILFEDFDLVEDLCQSSIC